MKEKLDFSIIIENQPSMNSIFSQIFGIFASFFIKKNIKKKRYIYTLM